MIRPVFVLFAEKVIHDQTSNAMSIINILEEVRPTGYPIVIPRFTIFVLTVRDEDDPSTATGVLTIKVDGEPVFSDERDLDFAEGRAMKNRNVLEFQGFVLPEPGVVSATFRVGDVEVESYPLPALPASAPPTLVQANGPAGSVSHPDETPSETN